MGGHGADEFRARNRRPKTTIYYLAERINHKYLRQRFSNGFCKIRLDCKLFSSRRLRFEICQTIIKRWFTLTIQVKIQRVFCFFDVASQFYDAERAAVKRITAPGATTAACRILVIIVGKIVKLQECKSGRGGGCVPLFAKSSGFYELLQSWRARVMIYDSATINRVFCHRAFCSYFLSRFRHR